MASSSSPNPAHDHDHGLGVDEFYLSALFDSGEVTPISDERYAVELHFQEALMSSAIYARLMREIKEEKGVRVKRELGGSSRGPATLKRVKREHGEDEEGTKMMMELAKEKQRRMCPNCKVYVERNKGCQHITCMCGFEFCYGCGVAWVSGHHDCGT